MVNNNNQLALDVAEDDAMKKLLQEHIDAAGKLFFVIKLSFGGKFKFRGFFQVLIVNK